MKLNSKTIENKLCYKLITSDNDGILNNVGERLKADEIVNDYSITSKRSLKTLFLTKTCTLWVDISKDFPLKEFERIYYHSQELYEIFEKGVKIK